MPTYPVQRHLPALPFLRMLLALLFALMLPAAFAGVPNKEAKPAYAEEQTMLQIEGDSVVREPGMTNAASGRVHMDRHFLGQYGSTEANVIVQRGGNTWRHLRNGPFALVAGVLLLVVPFILFVFYKTIGPIPEEPKTGRRIQRFTAWERHVHWATAYTFIALAITGIIIMYGKKIMLPWMGHDLFSWVAIISKYLHNFVGPLFILCSILMFITFVRRNFFNRRDWQWVKQGGGLVSHKHVPAGFFNAGEKAWFWLGVTLLGIVMSVSGLILDFVTFGQTRWVLQVANYLHIAGAALYIAAAMGHIFIGTWGTPGAYQAMREGTVDESWAQAHHAIWYEQVRNGGAPGVPPDGDLPRRPAPRPGPVH
ncbi:formate dehydrogenase subunit gamma [Massilia yuzhufengensis]|uniref:Formate dehydrogenase gamma subunit n=1 Tax=Massilia yuzhufengensis TaxID=1164594 RepID=A0A1I1QJU7_9BURK|nr:formate dehydrogenase subunit gamma [Massilia yuzhufengensis]SFD22424.1 formate dehydrogenase gamma subunit [Massilia yuzhufengensis]